MPKVLNFARCFVCSLPIDVPLEVGLREKAAGCVVAKVKVEDRLEAYDLLARYRFLIDEGDAEAWLGL